MGERDTSYHLRVAINAENIDSNLMNTFGHIFKLDAYSNKYAQFKEGSSKLYSINSSYLVYRKLLWEKRGLLHVHRACKPPHMSVGPRIN